LVLDSHRCTHTPELSQIIASHFGFRLMLSTPASFGSSLLSCFAATARPHSSRLEAAYPEAFRVFHALQCMRVFQCSWAAEAPSRACQAACWRRWTSSPDPQPTLRLRPPVTHRLRSQRRSLALPGARVGKTHFSFCQFLLTSLFASFLSKIWSPFIHLRSDLTSGRYSGPCGTKMKRKGM
jgi:hypothetical protein